MATENVFGTISGEFSEAVATQYLIAKLDTTANEFGIADTAATDIMVGVFQNTGDDGDSCSIAVLGIAKVLIGTGGVSKGERLTCEAGGSAITTTTLDDLVLGIAMEDGDDGDVIPVFLTPGMVYHLGAT